MQTRYAPLLPTQPPSILYIESAGVQCLIFFSTHRDKNVFNKKECICIVGSSRSIVVGVFRRESFSFTRRVSVSPWSHKWNTSRHNCKFLETPSSSFLVIHRQMNEKDWWKTMKSWQWLSNNIFVQFVIPPNSDKQKMMRCTFSIASFLLPFLFESWWSTCQQNYLQYYFFFSFKFKKKKKKKKWKINGRNLNKKKADECVRWPTFNSSTDTPRSFNHHNTSIISIRDGHIYFTKKKMFN